MINRKRVHSNVHNSGTDSKKSDVINCSDDNGENTLLFKCSNQPVGMIEEFFNKYDFATPGACTRSKTIGSMKLNPFDLSNPDGNTKINFNSFIWCPRLLRRASSTNKSDFENSVCNSLDSGFETESILSFASRSNDEESSSNVEICSNNLLLEPSITLLPELRQKSSPVQNCSETGYLLPIVADTSNEVLIPQISSLTLANILSGNHTLKNDITVFDCRFPYEYAGGHIVNSINVYTCQQLLQTMFPVKESCSDRKLEDDISNLREKLKPDDRIYVFYCEFSSYRAPKLAQCLRGLDRLAHFGGRDLFLPNVYVLRGGYRDFYNEYPKFCSPNNYVQMKKRRYPLRNLSENRSILPSELYRNKYRKEEKNYLREVQESEKKLKLIITKSTKDSDILQLFLSHPVIGGS